MLKKLKKFYQHYHLVINIIVFVLSFSSLMTIIFLPMIRPKKHQVFESPLEMLPAAETAAVKGSSVSILQIDQPIAEPATPLIGMKTEFDLQGKQIYKIYNQPNLNSPVIYQAPAGTTFFVYDERANWYMVKINTNEGELYGWVGKEKK